jgi:U3 small nucleolar RNA-associated protein 21
MDYGDGGGSGPGEFATDPRCTLVLRDYEAVCVTACGNFGLAGSSAGEIKMWNMQSGRERRSFALDGPPPGDTRPKIISASKNKSKAKAKAPVKSMQAITGVVTDVLNTMVVASTLEGKLYVSDEPA